MRIRLITPAPPGSRAGNRTTAARWAAILRTLGHRVQISVEYDGADADLMIALHAWRSAGAIQRFAAEHPSRPLIVAITGTDAYRFIRSHPEPTLRSIRLAHRLVGLHALIADVLPLDQRGKMRVIYQSALPIRLRDPVKRSFRVCVAGHLREEKDPLRPALAVRSLPSSSRIQIHHYGAAHTPGWAAAASAETALNSRYQWHGEVPHHQLRRVFGRSHLLVLPSRMEGGANVISEAVVAGLPVVASRIPGSIGLLGEAYPGFYACENSDELGRVLLRAESESSFYRQLAEACEQRRALFTPESEAAGWNMLLKELVKNPGKFGC